MKQLQVYWCSKTISCHAYAFSLPIHDACTMLPRKEHFRLHAYRNICQNQVIPTNITTTDKHTLKIFPVYSSFSFYALSMLLQSESPRFSSSFYLILGVCFEWCETENLGHHFTGTMKVAISQYPLVIKSYFFFCPTKCTWSNALCILSQYKFGVSLVLQTNLEIQVMTRSLILLGH